MRSGRWRWIKPQKARPSFQLMWKFWTLTFFYGGCLLDGNVLDGESEDDRPDHTKCHFDVSIDDFFGTNGHQSNAFGLDEVKS